MRRISWTTVPMFCPKCRMKVYGNECGYKSHDHEGVYYLPVDAKFLSKMEDTRK